MQYQRQTNFTEGTVLDSEIMDSEFNAVQAVINGNIDTDNISDSAITTDKIANAGVERANIKDGEVTNAKLDATAGEPGGAWKDWTPTLTSITLGAGSLACKYTQIGKTVHFRIRFTMGAGSAVGTNPRFSYPVAPHAAYIAIGIGNGRLEDVTGSWYCCFTFGYADAIYVMQIANVMTGVTATSPFTWATSDSIYLTGTYEAA
jgi:hypothetical protein